MVVSLLKKFKNIISTVFLCISMFFLGMSGLGVSALKTDEIIEKITEKMHEIESSKIEDKDEKYLFIKEVLNKYFSYCVCFNENKHNCCLFSNERACDSFKYCLFNISLLKVYREYGIASPEGLLKDLDNFIDSLGTLVCERSEEEKRWDDTYIQEFYRYEIFSWFVFQ